MLFIRLEYQCCAFPKRTLGTSEKLLIKNPQINLWAELKNNLFIFLKFIYILKIYFTFTLTPSEWELNSGAYIHCIEVMPFEKSPVLVTLSEYSNT